MKNLHFLLFCLLASPSIFLLTNCNDNDEPTVIQNDPDFSVSFFQEGDYSTPIKDIKFFLPAYDDSISDLSNTTGIYYKIANCIDGHNHTDITVDCIYSGNLKIKLVPNPTDVSCGKIIYWTPIGSECKRIEQIRLYVTDNKNNTTITNLNINVVPPPLNSIIRSGDKDLIVFDRDETKGTYKAYQAMGDSNTGLALKYSSTTIYWENLPDIEEAEYFLKNVYHDQKDKVKGIWYVHNNWRYIMLNDGSYQSIPYSANPEDEYYLILQIYDYYIPN